jgi:NAD(P)H-quinone oxidoreductase subunit 2
MLAYSSIAHVGYILMGLAAGRANGLSAMTFYIIVYGLFNLGAFTGAILFSNETGSDRIDDYAGLFRKRPWVALGISVCLLNLAGLPIPPAGFLAKLFIFWSAVQMHSNLGWLLVGTALLTSVPAIFYYTRVVIKMIVREPSEAVEQMDESRPLMPDYQFYPIVALSCCVIGIFACSFNPDPVFKLAAETVSPIAHHGELGCLPICR